MLGQRAPTQGPPRASKQWDEASFLAELQARKGAAQAGIAKGILDWAKQRNLGVGWGKGKAVGSFYPLVEGGRDGLVGVYTDFPVQVQFGALKGYPPFSDEAKRRELLRRLKEIPGISIPDDQIEKFPSFPLSALSDEANLGRFLDALDWALLEIGAARGQDGREDER